jgi:hypothetical protein
VKPLVIDLFCGLGGWTKGFLSEGYDALGFDIERHEYWMPDRIPEGDGSKGTRCAISLGMEGVNSQPRTRLARYPAQLILQDVLTLHGSQFRNAAAIVASPPCQAYSYRAMPWKRAKALPPPSNELFDACFRIQREASEAAGHHIPMVVENVKGAQPWVGRAAWHYGSFYLWGDVPALMPWTGNGRMKHPAPCGPRLWKDRDVVRLNDGADGGQNEPHAFHQKIGTKNEGGSWFGVAHNTESGVGQNPVNGLKGMSGLHGFSHPDGTGGRDFGGPNDPRRFNSRSSARKAASAQIAEIPFDLAQWIARCFLPVGCAEGIGHG